MLRFLSLPPASACSAALLLLSLAQSSTCLPGSLWPRAKTIPAPISFSPAQNWEGIDGSWNTFVLRVGTPVQTVRVIVSTASQQTWVVDPRGCPDDTSTNNTCSESRGTTFNLELSKSWKPQGLYDLWIESNLGLQGNAEYGYETVGLGYPGEGGPTLTAQTVGALATPNFWYGHFGINPKPTNFTNYTSQSPSFLTTLKDQNLIPSVSWGYTAGAPYRFAKVLASLTLGGYDSSRLIPNGISFPFAPDNERDILVSIESITSTDMSGTKTSLLPKQVYSYIDSTVAEIWLPVESCVLFEKAFGLTWDPESELYLVPDALHNQLTLTNPNITFNIAPFVQASGRSDSVSISLPYAAFDLTAKPPYQFINKTSRYFPLRRAENDTEYTLGRTFLQEAFLTVDWERQNFSVSQCSWVAGAQQHIIPIQSINGTTGNGTAGGAAGTPTKMTPLSGGAIAGIAVGAVAILLLSAVLALMYLRKRKPRKEVDEEPNTKTVDTESSKDDDGTGATTVFPKAELDANTPAALRHEADDGTFYNPKAGLDRSQSSSHANLVHEFDAKEREIFEMEGDMPKRQEADGRPLGEKEAMRVREERINGVDPSSNSPTTPVASNEQRSPTSTLASSGLPSTLDSSRRRGLVTPGEVIELNPLENRTLLPVSPLEGSEGSRTLMFSPLSPVTPGGDNSPDTARKRFSYEDP